MLMAFKADGRSSSIVMAWPECENLTSVNLEEANDEEIVANIRTERRQFESNVAAIMGLIATAARMQASVTFKVPGKRASRHRERCPNAEAEAVDPAA
jgi:hypothetical protein